MNRIKKSGKRSAEWFAAWILMALGMVQGPDLRAGNTTDSIYCLYVAKYQDLARSQMRNHRIPASITMAQALLESSGGLSPLALKSNNHFGIKCGKNWTGDSAHVDDDKPKDCFRAYKSVDSSYADRVIFLAKARYKFLFDSLDVRDYKGWAHGLKKAGYATDATYPTRLIALIERLELHRLDHDSLVWPNPETSAAQPVPVGQPDSSVQVGQGMAVAPTRSVPDSAQLRYAQDQKWIYVTQEGDSPLSVAKKNGIDLYVLQSYNQLPLDLMLFQTGRILVINRHKYQKYLRSLLD